MAELASLRARIDQAEEIATRNQASAEVLSKMIQAGAAQVGENNIIEINPSQQKQSFGADVPDQNQG